MGHETWVGLYLTVGLSANKVTASAYTIDLYWLNPMSHVTVMRHVIVCYCPIFSSQGIYEMEQVFKKTTLFFRI